MQRSQSAKWLTLLIDADVCRRFANAAADAAVMSSISRRDQNLISGSRMEACTFRGGAMSARTTMKIAFVMEMADDGVTDVPSADAPDGLTDGTGRRQRRIMCDKSQRRAKANRSKKERGDLFVCPISNGQSE